MKHVIAGQFLWFFRMYWLWLRAWSEPICNCPALLDNAGSLFGCTFSAQSAKSAALSGILARTFGHCSYQWPGIVGRCEMPNKTNQERARKTDTILHLFVRRPCFDCILNRFKWSASNCQPSAKCVLALTPSNFGFMFRLSVSVSVFPGNQKGAGVVRPLIYEACQRHL